MIINKYNFLKKLETLNTLKGKKKHKMNKEFNIIVRKILTLEMLFKTRWLWLIC